MADTAKVIQFEPDVQRHVRARLARLPSVVHRTQEKGKRLLLECFDMYFEAADDALFELADAAANNREQNAYFEAMREIRVQRKGIERRFFDLIEEGFARLVDNDVRDSIKTSEELSADALSLVRNDDLEQMASLEATINRANGKFFVPMQAFSSKLDPLVPAKVTDQNNPFGPAVICTSFMSQLKRLDVEAQAKFVLFELFDRVVLDALHSLLQKLTGVLGQQAVGQEKAAPAAPSPRQKVSEEDKQQSNSDSLIELLSFIQKLPVSASNRNMDIEMLLESVQSRRGKTLNLTPVQKETIKIVQLLFEFFTRDAHLAQAVKDQLIRLQIPVLKLSLIEKSFITDKQHPARALINEIAAFGLGWQDSASESGKDSGPLKMIRITADRIINEFVKDSRVFSLALTDFTTFVAKEKRRMSILERRTLDAEDGRAKAEMARDKVQKELDLRTMAYDLPQNIKSLVFGPWRNVLFVSGLKKGFDSPEWSAHVKTLSELVWSIQPCQNAGDRQRLIRLVPDLVMRLRKGLDSVSHNPFEVAEHFKALEDIHLARIRGEALPYETATDSTPSIEETMAQLDEVNEPEPELDPVPTLPAVDESFLQRARGFSTGAWFDVADENEAFIRCRLAAIIKATGKYIFINRNGAKVAEKSLEELAADLKNGRIKAIDDSQLFDRALESIVSGLRKPASNLPMDEK